jgi:HEAT repeat protein
MEKTMKNHLLLTICLAALIIAPAAASAANGEPGPDSPLQKAKQLIYHREWRPAVEALRVLIASGAKGDATAEAIYWRGYCLNQLAGDQEDASAPGAISAWKQAFADMDAVMKGFSESRWRKPAEVLRIEIAENLAEKGLKEYEKYISHAAEQDPDGDLKLVAVDALLQMDGAKAFPILEKIIRGDSPAKLKEKALFVLSQTDDPRSIQLLDEVARSNEIPALREKAIFWLGQSDGSLPRLKSLLAAIGDPALKKKVLFAVSQQDDPAAADILLAVARGNDPLKLREEAIFWLSQQDAKGNAARLAALYAELKPFELRKKVIFALSQIGDRESTKHLADLYRRESDPELKKQIIFWMGQIDSDESRRFLDSILNG